MKSAIFNCALLLVFLCNICSAQSTSSNCKNDSTVVSFYFNNQDGDISYGESITVYDLDSGITTSMGNYYPPGGPWSGYSVGNGYWDKIDTIYTAFGALQEILTSTGSPNGWVNSKSERQEGFSFVINNRFYTGEGIDNNLIIHHSDLWEYDPSLESWSAKTSLPVGLLGSKTFTIGNSG